MLNGKETEVPDQVTARGLLDELGLPPQAVVVERNEKVIRRSELATALLAPGDRIEIIQMIAGG